MSKPDNQCPPSWVKENEDIESGLVEEALYTWVGGGCVSATFSNGGLSKSNRVYQYGHVHTNLVYVCSTILV